MSPNRGRRVILPNAGGSTDTRARNSHVDESGQTRGGDSNMTQHSAALMLCCLAILPGASAATILNPSFEQPVTSSFTYNPLDPTLGWTFSGRTGVAINTFFTPPPPDGNQPAFIQQPPDQPTSLSTTPQSLAPFALPPPPLVFFLAQRPDHLVNPINVLYASQNLGTFTPASPT